MPLLTFFHQALTFTIPLFDQLWSLWLKFGASMTSSAEVFHPRTGPEKDLIRLIWKIQHLDCRAEKEMILPKGTAEIIFDISDGTLCFKDDEKQSFAFYRCNINGLNTSPYHLIKGHSQTFIGVQLHPFALKFLFETPGREFTDVVHNGFDVCPSLRQLFDELTQASSFDDEVRSILAWFRKRTANMEVHEDRLLLFDLHRQRNMEELSVRSICDRYNLSDRHLRRLSDEYLGLNMEDFILYGKYLKGLSGTHSGYDSLTEVAHESGFYDQPHFIRTFKTFTGITPGEYRRQRSHLMGHLFHVAEPMSV